MAKWLNDLGITVFMLKYRTVHSEGDNPMAGLFSLFTKDSTETWQKMNEVAHLAGQDGLKAMEYVRSHSKEYNLDTNKLGLLGFSAGGSVVLSVLYQAEEKNRPDFAAAIYTSDFNTNNKMAPSYKVPIFLAAASDDSLGLTPVSITTYQKWIKAKQSAELHIYEKGGHGFALKKQNLSSDSWTCSFEEWLRLNKIIPTN
ncbi:alpha/beta hydrolase [Sphingobacterium sp.]|uniref:alpha/beta hydrolase n=1 Tax=Sphingobacterium sp. TaxID=341027 RepID=UPI0031CDF7FA